MVYGWAGVDLEVDLSQRKIEKHEGDPKLNETYLGGRGIGTRILLERVLPEVTLFSPENLMILGPVSLRGPLPLV